MIYGLGIDIVSAERLEEIVKKWGRRFLERVFTSRELDYCLERKNPYLSLSARFAAKEAMIKAMGGRKGITMKDIEVINTETGKPIINSGIRLREYLDSIGVRRVHLSLTHEAGLGMAFVILED